MKASTTGNGSATETHERLTIDFAVRGTEALSNRESVWASLSGAAVLLLPLARRVRMKQR